MAMPYTFMRVVRVTVIQDHFRTVSDRFWIFRYRFLIFSARFCTVSGRFLMSFRRLSCSKKEYQISIDQGWYQSQADRPVDPSGPALALAN